MEPKEFISSSKTSFSTIVKNTPTEQCASMISCSQYITAGCSMLAWYEQRKSSENHSATQRW